MRNLVILVLALVSGVVLGQKKPNINRAKSLFDKGEYAAAKAEIDNASTYEKTMGKAKTWYFRGMIYSALDTALNEPGAMATSVESFEKALELDPEQKSIQELDLATGALTNVDSRLNGYYSHYFNNAVEAYNTSDWPSAAENFEKASLILEEDTTAVLNAGIAASAAGNDEAARRNFVRCSERNVKEKSVYLQLYNYAYQDGNNEEALSWLKRGRELFPDDSEFPKYEINLYINMGKTDEAKKELETSIEKDPNNPDLLFNLAVLKEESGDKEGAREAYKKAISIDENHFNSNFNYGVMGFTETNELLKERNNLEFNKDYEKKNSELTSKIEAKMKEILPTWEKLYELNSGEQSVLETLSYIYNFLEMEDKAKEIDALLDK